MPEIKSKDGVFWEGRERKYAKRRDDKERAQ